MISRPGTRTACCRSGRWASTTQPIIPTAARLVMTSGMKSPIFGVDVGVLVFRILQLLRSRVRTPGRCARGNATYFLRCDEGDLLTNPYWPYKSSGGPSVVARRHFRDPAR